MKIPRESAFSVPEPSVKADSWRLIVRKLACNQVYGLASPFLAQIHLFPDLKNPAISIDDKDESITLKITESLA